MRVLCELSGGADSTLAAIMAKNKYPKAEFFSLFVNYNQKAVSLEVRASQDIHRMLGWPISSWKSVGIYDLFDGPLINTVSGDVDKVWNNLAAAYLPLRNLVIGAIAVSWADAIKADVIISGSKGLVKIETDPYSFKDSTVPFYVLMEAVANYAKESGRVSIEPILAENRNTKMTKKEVYRQLRSMGFTYTDTVSCFTPVGNAVCGKCKNCVEKRRLWDEIVQEENECGQ